jgi:hypothetical protein
MVVEVPRWTNAKMEIATKEKMNPIKQDVKKVNFYLCSKQIIVYNLRATSDTSPMFTPSEDTHGTTVASPRPGRTPSTLTRTPTKVK